MMGLVDYGSGSDSDSDEETNAQPQIAIINKTKSAPKSNAMGPAVLDDGFFDEDIPENDNSGLKLPSASGIEHKTVAEGELEGDVKPRDWEIQLAEQNKKKLEKKLEKKAKKKDKKKKHKKEMEEKEKVVAAPKKQVMAKISAFGALAALAKDSDSEDDEPTPRPATSAPNSTNGSKVGLFSILPAPKTGGKKTSLVADNPGTGFLLPPSLRKKAAPAPAPEVNAAPSFKRKADSDDSDGEDVTDFFGLTSAPEAKQSRFDDIPLMPSTGFGEAIGPSKPPVEEEPMYDSEMYDYADQEGPSTAPARRKGFINDEMAYNLLSRDETVQVHDRRSLNEITAGIIDVNVDQALGPNLQASLLKNITRHAGAAQMPGGLPPKNAGDKAARQKHQITYLAQLAVSRDAALQEQWASSRHQKRMGREKYGF